MAEKVIQILQGSDVARAIGQTCQSCMWADYINPVKWSCHRTSPPWVEVGFKDYCGEFEQRPKELVTNA